MPHPPSLFIRICSRLCRLSPETTFGGDYFYVEASLGCVAMARRGITLALTELVNEGWFSLDDALELTDLIMYRNAHQLFGLDHRKKYLENPPLAPFENVDRLAGRPSSEHMLF